MKKILSLFTVLVLTLTSSAQVAFLQRTNSYPDESSEHPEQNAYQWFRDTYSASSDTILSIDEIKSGALLNTGVPRYKVLWVNVDAQGTAAWDDNLVGGSEVIRAIEAYVKAGGNLLLTKQAAWIVPKIGRMKYSNDTDYNPSWSNNTYAVGGDIWTINAMIGVGYTLRDARQHPIFDNMTKGSYNSYAHESFPLVGKVNRVDNNFIWTEMEPKAGGDTPNDNIATLNNFQSDWKCQVLAVWGQVRDYCAPAIVEFYPDGDYKGSIMTISSNAYQWGTSNYDDDIDKGYISNVQTLTSNALNYLSHGGVEYGYVLPYALSEIYTPGGEDNTYHPDYNAAKWFYKEYIEKDKGRFIHKGEAIPDGMKVLWINNDRSAYINVNSFYNDLGGDDFKNQLDTFVQDGGNLFLTKQATRLVKDIGRCSASLDYRMNGWQGKDDNSRYMTADFYALKDANENRVGFDRHDHPVYKDLSADDAWVTHNEKGQDVYCKWQLMDFTTANRRTDNNAIWENHWEGYAESDHLARATKFETDDTCRILGGYGHTTALDGAGFVEFLPTATYSGTVMALGLCTYQWGDNNSMVSRIENLTKGVLDYLNNGTDTYTRSVTPDNYGTICLPRASSATSGATFFRAFGKTAEGVVIEEVAALEAGKPYIFQATASTLTVTYTGAAVSAPDNSESNGLIGSFYRTLIPDNEESDFRCILKDNGIYKVNHSYVGANRAYFDLSAMGDYDLSQSISGRRRLLGIDRSGMPTDVENVEAVKIESRKVIENGQLFIIKNGVKYNAQGQIVK